MSGPTTALLDAALARRAPLLASGELDALRLLNGAGDGAPGLFLDRLGDAHFLHVEEGCDDAPWSAAIRARWPGSALWRKWLRRDLRTKDKDELAPELLHGGDTPELTVREGALRFLVRPREGYSSGLFLDQRDNRRRLRDWIARRGADVGGPPTLLNTFAYTCSFSVAAARAGAMTTSVDLSARWLEWGRRNFAANALAAAGHDFAQGEALTYLAIAAKKRRRFDAIVLDPPTFSSSKQRGVFRVERDFEELATLALQVAAPGALLLASHNQRTFENDALALKLRTAASAAGRKIASLEPLAPPPDFPGPPRDNPAARGFWITVD